LCEGPLLRLFFGVINRSSNSVDSCEHTVGLNPVASYSDHVIRAGHVIRKRRLNRMSYSRSRALAVIKVSPQSYQSSTVLSDDWFLAFVRETARTNRPSKPVC